MNVAIRCSLMSAWLPRHEAGMILLAVACRISSGTGHASRKRIAATASRTGLPSLAEIQICRLDATIFQASGSLRALHHATKVSTSMPNKTGLRRVPCSTKRESFWHLSSSSMKTRSRNSLGINSAHMSAAPINEFRNQCCLSTTSKIASNKADFSGSFPPNRRLAWITCFIR